MVFLMLAPVLCAFVGIGALAFVTSIAARDINGNQRNISLPVVLHFPVEEYVSISAGATPSRDTPAVKLQRSPSVHNMSVVDGMSVRLDTNRNAPVGYHGAIFENEAKNFSRDGLITGVGEQRKPGVHYGKLFVPLSAGGDNVEGKWFAVDRDVADNTTIDAFDNLKNAVSEVTGEIANPQDALHLATALIAAAEEIKWE